MLSLFIRSPILQIFVFIALPKLPLFHEFYFIRSKKLSSYSKSKILYNYAVDIWLVVSIFYSGLPFFLSTLPKKFNPYITWDIFEALLQKGRKTLNPVLRRRIAANWDKQNRNLLCNNLIKKAQPIKCTM